MISAIPKYNVDIKAVTWNKDSHGLFDYESKSLDVKKFSTDKDCVLIRNGKEVNKMNADSQNTKQTNEMTPEKFDRMINISFNQKDYYFSPTIPTGKTGEILEKEHEPYLIVRSMKNSEGQIKGAPLEPGAIIKLGRIEYVVLEFRLLNDEVKTMPEIKNTFYGNTVYESDNEFIDEGAICRICLAEDHPHSTLINPCNCKGNSKYVHFSCLQNWIKTKVNIKPSLNTITYSWKRLECEVCKTPLAKKYCFSKEKLDIVDVHKPGTPYLLLENIVREKNTSKSVILLQALAENDVLTLGRGHKCDLIITDISVSRLHATIKLQKNGFVLYDNSSKFGTLMLVKDLYPITGEKIAIQVGRTVITFVKKYKDSSQPEEGNLKKKKLPKSNQPAQKPIETPDEDLIIFDE